MRKNVMLALALALAALATVPTLAQAVIRLEAPVGTTMAKGSSVTLDSKNFYLQPNFLFTCSDLELGGKLISNSDPAIELTTAGISTGCAGGGMTATVTLSPPTTVAFGEEAGAGQTRVNGVTLNLSIYQSGYLLAKCAYAGSLTPTYSFGENLALAVSKTGLTRVSGESGLCQETMYIGGSFAVSQSGNAARATSEAPKFGSFGVFRNSGGTRSHVFAGEVIQSYSKNASFKLAGGGATVTCTNVLLSGAATEPAAKPAVTSVSSASFTGDEGSKWCSWSGLNAEVTATASKLRFADKAGESGIGALEGPVQMTIKPYLFGSPVATCVYEVSSIGTTYSFEKALELKYAVTTMPRVSGNAEVCKASVEANLGEGTVTLPSAGNLPVEVLAG